MSINGGNIDEGSCLSGENDEGSAVYSETKRAASPVPSCVSMKSDHSMFEPPAFSDGGELPRLENQRITSPVPSCVSMKSDHSMFEPPAFRNEAKRPRFDTKQQRAASSELSCVSMKSSHSMFEPPAFINGPKHSVSENQQTAASVPSCVSVKSSHSMFEPPAFSDKAKRPRFDTKQKNTASSELSCVSMKSSHSMFEPPAFRNEAKRPRFDTKQQRAASSELSCVSMKSSHSMFEPPAFINGPKHSVSENQQTAASVPSCVSVKSSHSMFEPPAFSDKAKRPRFDTKQKNTASSELSCVSMKSSHSMFEPPAFSSGPKNFTCGLCGQIFKDPASSSSGHSFCTQCISRYWEQSGSSGNSNYPHCTKRSGTQPSLQPSTNVDSMEHKQPGEDILQKVLRNHKAIMKSKYECLFEGIPTHDNRTLLNSVYTQLYIIEGESEGVNEEHEILQVQNMFQGCKKGIPVNYSDIFRPLPEQSLEEEHERNGLEERKFKTVLTKGIAGIGKTVSVQKFVLDWAEGKANQDVDFMFMLPFRELNLIKDDQYSLHALLCVFHPELKGLDPKMYDACKIMFILDGLDESRISLNITASSQSKTISDVTKKSSVGVLMTNIIKGELLPSALIWITSRPAAASQIPSRYVSRVTEIQGFSDPQKEEYFKKRISDPYQASRVFSQITKAKTLYIMCHIPIFCWISSIVIQQILEQDTCGEIPTTLTEMYIHFMLIQTKTKNLKYHVKDDETDLKKREEEMILKIAELAFKQLIKGNILFYVEDLRECGIDVTEASVYSGVCTEIFKEESVLYQKKVFCFVHLSFQEFFAAVFGFHACVAREAEVVKMFQSRSKSNGGFVDTFMMSAIDKALTSTTGHLDLFLRFLYGISRESNWKLLYHIVPPKCRISEDFQDTIQRVRQKHPKNVSPERWINFLHCFIEMKDNSFQREVKSLLNAKRNLTGWDCTRIAYSLQMSEEVLDEFDPKKYKTSDEGRRRLIPVVRNCRKALLANFKLTKQHCEIVISALQSANSVLTELDLSYNDIQDSGVKQLCECLKNPYCKLETLRLVMCNLTKKTCEYVAPALQSANSGLKELDLSQNDLEDSGVRLLSGGLKSSHCQLETLRLSGCLVTEEGCASLASALSSNPSHLRELDLSYNHPGESGMKLLRAKVDDPNYKLDKLNFNYGGVFTMKPGVRKYACELTVDLNTINTELVLSENNRKVTYVWEEEKQQSYPDHPERFQCAQLLCRESLSGRCYWEAEWSGWRAGIAVAYKGTTRKHECGFVEFGSNEDSWGLFGYQYKKKYSVHHKYKKIFIPAPRSCSNRVGVYLDWPAGMLSFYSVLSDGSTLSHLHTVQCRFTEPLYAGFFVYDASVSLCHL